MSHLELDNTRSWLSREELDSARERLPILYVDAVPVRVDERGAVAAVGLLLRARLQKGALRLRPLQRFPPCHQLPLSLGLVAERTRLRLCLRGTLRLLPPESSVRGSRLAVDDVSLVRWGEEGGSSARFDTVLAERATAVTLQQVTPTAATEPTVLRATSNRDRVYTDR